MFAIVQVNNVQEKYPNMNIAISQKCVLIIALNCVHLFRTNRCSGVLLNAVFTSLTPK